MLTKFKSTIIKQKASGKLPSRRLRAHTPPFSPALPPPRHSCSSLQVEFGIANLSTLYRTGQPAVPLEATLSLSGLPIGMLNYQIVLLSLLSQSHHHSLIPPILSRQRSPGRQHRGFPGNLGDGEPGEAQSVSLLILHRSLFLHSKLGQNQRTCTH